MTLILTEGFELQDLTRNFTSWTGLGFSTSVFRTGTTALYSNNSPEYATKQLAVADEHATLIIGFGHYQQQPERKQLVSLMSDSQATAHISLTSESDGSYQVRRGDWNGTVLGTTTSGLYTATTWHYVELKVTLHDSTGVVGIHVDGTSVLSLTGQDTKNGGTKTGFDSFRFGSVDGSSSDGYYDDLYLCTGAGSVNNDFLGECRVRTLYPNGNGATSNGVGSDSNSVNNYLLVDEAILVTGTADYVDLAATNDEDTYTFDDLPDTSGTVAAVQLIAYAEKTDAGAKSLALVTRISSTDYASSDQVLGTSFAYKQSIRETSPATATAFTRAEVNGAEFGVRARP